MICQVMFENGQSTFTGLITTERPLMDLHNVAEETVTQGLHGSQRAVDIQEISMLHDFTSEKREVAQVQPSADVSSDSKPPLTSAL